MQRKRFRFWLVAVTAAALLVSAGAVLAENAPADGTAQSPHQTFLAKVAAGLGIPVDRLTGAMKDASTQMVDEAVQQGRLTEAQAAMLRERISQGGYMFGPGGPGWRGGRGHGWGRHGWGHGGYLYKGAMIDTAAATLGMKSQDLLDELGKGKTLAQVAEAKGHKRDDLKTAMLAEVQKRLDQAVADGTLTKDQAAKLKENSATQVDRMLDSAWLGKGKCRFGPGGGTSGDTGTTGTTGSTL